MYDSATNSVWIRGVEYPHNPSNGDAWTPESAQAYIDAQLAEQASSDELAQQASQQAQLTIVTTSARMKVGGAAVEIQQPYNLLVVESGKALEVLVEVQDGHGNLLTHLPDGSGGFVPLTKTFTLPIIGLYGTPMEVIDVDFVEGKATAEITFPVPGMWRITSEQVNMHIANPAEHFVFAGLEFKAKRPAA